LNAQQAAGYCTLAAVAKVMQAQGELPLAAREGALGHDFGSLLAGIKSRGHPPYEKK